MIERLQQLSHPLDNGSDVEDRQWTYGGRGYVRSMLYGGRCRSVSHRSIFYQILLKKTYNCISVSIINLHLFVAVCFGLIHCHLFSSILIFLQRLTHAERQKRKEAEAKEKPMPLSVQWWIDLMS